MDKLEKHMSREEIRFQALAEVAWLNRRSGVDITRPAIIELCELAESINEPLTNAIVDLLNGLFLFYGNDYPKAHNLVERASHYFETSPELLWYARSLIGLALVEATMGNLTIALDYWHKCLPIARANQFEEVLGFCLYNIADLNRGIFGRYQDAFTFFTEALELCTDKEHPHIMFGSILAGISKCEQHFGHSETALWYAEKAIEVTTAKGDLKSLPFCIELAATLYKELGQFEKALAYGQESLDQRMKLNDKIGIANSSLTLAQIYMEIDQLEKAFECAQTASKICGELKSTILLDNIYKTTAEIQEKRGNLEDAIVYYKLHAKQREINITQSLEQKLSMIAAEMHLETAKKDAEIYRLINVSLKEKNDAVEKLAIELATTLKNLEITQEQLIRSEKMNSLVGLVSGVAHEINTPLGNSVTLASYLQSCHENFQNALNQSLVGRNHLIDYLFEEKDVLDRLESNLTRTAQIVQSFKKIAINPSAISRQVISPKQFFQDWLSTLHIQYQPFNWEVQFLCPINETVDMEVDVQSITQLMDELFLNAIKHGYPSSLDGVPVGQSKGLIQIELTFTEDSWQLTFKDFGAGIEKEDISRIFEPFNIGHSKQKGMGLGLHLVYNIVTLILAGTISIASEVGKGTTVTINVKGESHDQ